MTIRETHQSLKEGKLTCRELAEKYLKKIGEKNPELNAYLEIYDDVLLQADEAQKKFEDGSATALTGIPLAIKGVILIQGKKSTAASKILGNYVASYDATAISKLKKEGAVFLGETNLDEFAMGGSTENSAYGVTRNPHDTGRVAGGSSGGSVAAVAAEMALGALGSDTGGSVREPAAFCGVVGIKPTYGRVSRSGLIAMGSSLDCIGPIGRTVEDVQIIYEAIKGEDALDSTSGAYPAPRPQKAKGIVGVPSNLINQNGIDEKVKENFRVAVDRVKKAGYEVRDIDIPNLDLSLAVYYIIMPAEASTNLARYEGMRYGLHQSGGNLLGDYLMTRAAGFGPEVRRRILLGTYVLSAGYYDAYYGKAQAVRAHLIKEFAEAFKKVDFVMTPTAPGPAWKIGEKSDPLSVYLADVFTVTANIVGVPAISIPSGTIDLEGRKLPLGVQFMAPHFAEDSLFEISKKFETYGPIS